MRKPTICISSNCTADQRLCFRCTDGTILLLKSEISSFEPASVTVQACFCRTWSEPKLLVFSRIGSFFICLLDLWFGVKAKSFVHVGTQDIETNLGNFQPNIGDALHRSPDIPHHSPGGSHLASKLMSINQSSKRRKKSYR